MRLLVDTQLTEAGARHLPFLRPAIGKTYITIMVWYWQFSAAGVKMFHSTADQLPGSRGKGLSSVPDQEHGYRG